MDKTDDVLKHFGILGMQWGRRKARGGVSKSPARKTSSVHEDAARKNQLKKKKLSQMSNEELKTLNTRLQLEKQYKELTKADTSAGKKFVNDILTNAAKQTASTYASKVMTKGTESVLKTILKP